jgi:hypothetical protein
MMKKMLLILCFGFLLGSTFTGLVSPSMIAWYFDPPTSIGVSCKEAVVWGIAAYQKLLLIGGAVGLGIASVIAILTRRKVAEQTPSA